MKRLEKRQRAEFDLFVFGGLSIVRFMENIGLFHLYFAVFSSLSFFFFHQKEFKFWCTSKSNKAMFDGVDKSLKIDLYLASGGVPLMLEDFKTTYAEMVSNVVC